MTVLHLARRFITSLRRHAPEPADTDWAGGWLSESERDLWDSMPAPDRRHSIEVARRFQTRRPGAHRAEMAGALLHDVGKTASGFGTFGRVLATVIGPRSKRLRQYHDHEAIGAGLAESVGSDQITVALVRGAGAAADDLRAADDSI